MEKVDSHDGDIILQNGFREHYYNSVDSYNPFCNKNLNCNKPERIKKKKNPLFSIELGMLNTFTLYFIIIKEILT